MTDVKRVRSIYLTKDLESKLSKYASEADITVSHLVRIAIKQYLKGIEKDCKIKSGNISFTKNG